MQAMHNRISRARDAFFDIVLEITARVRTRDAVLNIMSIIALRAHWKGFNLICDLGLCEVLLGIAPRARARGGILCIMSGIGLRVRVVRDYFTVMAPSSFFLR